MNITNLKNGTIAKIKSIKDIKDMNKLKSMGIFPGNIIIKKSNSIMKGPIIIQIGKTQIAIGYKIAQNIIIECL
jgi:Fe2+ transport system protein FeoA